MLCLEYRLTRKITYEMLEMSGKHGNRIFEWMLRAKLAKAGFDMSDGMPITKYDSAIDDTVVYQQPLVWSDKMHWLDVVDFYVHIETNRGRD